MDTNKHELTPEQTTTDNACNAVRSTAGRDDTDVHTMTKSE